MYQAIVAIHVIAAVTWLGGMLFLVMVMVPLARRDAGPGFAWLRQAAERFVPVAWISMVLLVLTGGYLATDHWGIGVGDFFSGGIHFINILQIKTALFLIVILISLAHDFWLGPKMMDRLEAARHSGQPLPRGPARGVRSAGGQSQPGDGGRHRGSNGGSAWARPISGRRCGPR